jgi:hypothetical protein
MGSDEAPKRRDFSPWGVPSYPRQKLFHKNPVKPPNHITDSFQNKIELA